MKRIVLVRGGRARVVSPTDAARTPRRAKRNTILMTIGAPNRPAGARRATRNDGKYRPNYTKRTLALAELNQTALVKKGLARFAEFHQGGQATKADVIEIDDGKPGVTEQVLVEMGKADLTIDTVEDEQGREVHIKPMKFGVGYRVPSRADSPEKKGRQYIHDFREDGGQPPCVAFDVETGIMQYPDGSYEIQDWIHR